MTDPDASARIDQAVAGLWAVLLTTLVLIPCITPTLPVMYFDTDPRLGPTGSAVSAGTALALGPLGVSVLQLLQGVAAVGALVWAVTRGAALRRGSSVAVMVGMAFAAKHAFDGDARWEDWQQAGAWISAAAVGLAGLHLAGFAAARRWAAALLIAATVPLTLEAVYYVFVEHPMSVRFFEQYQAELIEARGMVVGSEQAELYERRARFADATGAFGLSNVLASVAGALGLLGLGVAVGNGFEGKSRRWRGIVPAGMGAAAGLTVIALTGSKGAALAAAMAVGLLAWLGVTERLKPWRRWTPGLAVGLVVIAFSAVLVRGAMGPPPLPDDGFVPGRPVVGERSLLFRFHYWSGAAQVWLDAPLFGSGPRGFADVYPAVKNPINPETVSSTHNMFVDYVTMLGVGGLAWSGLLLVWLFRAGRVSSSPTAAEPIATGSHPRVRVWTAGAAAAVLFGLTLMVRRAGLLPETALLWIIAAAGFGVLAATLAKPGRLSDTAIAWGLLAAATFALVHNQIEMAFFQAGAVAVLWWVLGFAGGVRQRPPQEGGALPGLRTIGPVVVGGFAVLVIMLTLLVGVARHESAMASASAALRGGNYPAAVAALTEAQSAAGLDVSALRWRTQIAALEPMTFLLQNDRGEEAARFKREAVGWLGAAAQDHPKAASIARLEARLLDQWAQMTHDAEDFAAAEDAYDRLHARSPYNAQDLWARAQLAERQGEREKSRERYRRLLKLRERSYLDAADPLTSEQLEHVRLYLDSSTP